MTEIIQAGVQWQPGLDKEGLEMTGAEIPSAHDPAAGVREHEIQVFPQPGQLQPFLVLASSVSFENIDARG